MDPLEDELNLRLLRQLVSGNGVHVNISAVSKEYKIHRTTAKRKVESFYQNGILNSPLYPFPRLYDEYPLLVIAKADMPRSAKAREFYRDDSHIFAAFSCMEGSYNTLLVEFFKDLESYHSWREQIVRENKIPSRENRLPAHADIFSNRLTFKYDPNCFINDMEREFKKEDTFELGGLELNELTFSLLKDLLNGKFIRTNDSAIGRELGVNRKTIRSRIDSLLEQGIIEEPRCFFPNLFIPPDYNLVVSLIEVRSDFEDVRKYLANDNNIPRAVETSTEKYNFLIFSAFKTIEDFFSWGDDLNSRFRDDIGAISNTILSSQTIHTIKPQKVSLGLIERRLWEFKGK